MNVIAKLFTNDGLRTSFRVFPDYVTALRWCKVTTGISRVVCTAQYTAQAAHEPGELPRWTITPIKKKQESHYEG